METRLILHLDDEAKTTLEILSFEYDAKRMAGAPVISATIKSFSLLDINMNCYTEFKGEKYYVKQTPTRTKDNSDARYKYEINFVSERDILDNIYFYDTAKSNSTTSNRVAHNTKFHWSGTIVDYVDKLNESLLYSLGSGSYQVSKDGLSSNLNELEYKFISLEDQYFTVALQEIYNTFGVPYYFDGKTIYIGYESNSLNSETEFEYGIDKGLISVVRDNANYKVVNKCTAVGSSENLPYYYPNVSATGEHSVSSNNVTLSDGIPVVFDVLSKHTNIADGATLTFHKKPTTDVEHYTWWRTLYERPAGAQSAYQGTSASSFTDTLRFWVKGNKIVTEIELYFYTHANEDVELAFGYACQTRGDNAESEVLDSKYLSFEATKVVVGSTEVGFTLEDGILKFSSSGKENELCRAKVTIGVSGLSEEALNHIKNNRGNSYPIIVSMSVQAYRIQYKEDYFTFDDSEKYVYVSKSGVNVKYSVVDGEIVYVAKDKGTVTIGASKNLMPYQPNLMPSIYRGTLGAERFYEARNSSYTVSAKDDDGNPLSYSINYGGAVFGNPYNKNTRNYREHTFTVDDLKPTIKEMEYKGKRIDVIADVKFDNKNGSVVDNNEINDNNEYKHSYFYVKLNPLGFNLFEHASESGDMTISFTSGDCTSCNFTIGVNDNKENDFQVDSKGNLLFDKDGFALRGKAQPTQNDTTDNHVWIALKKEDSTYGTLMPDYSRNVVPNVGDSFVILNINLPQSYILAAEQKLENKIKEYLVDNNAEKFNFSIKFSRIFLAENDVVREQLNENARIYLHYDGDIEGTKKGVWLYVSGFSYKMSEGEILPEISVTVTDTLATQQSPLQNVVNQVKAEVQTSIDNIDIVAQAARSFLRKDTNDQTTHTLTVNTLNINEDTNARGNLTVQDRATVKGELEVNRKSVFKDSVNISGEATWGNYREILGEISGGKVDQQGNASFKSIRANYLEVFTMIYNQIKASSAYTVFDDTGTIIDISKSGDVYTLTFDESEFAIKDNNSGIGIQPFDTDDIIHGYVNKINNYDYSVSGECWMYVIAIPSTDSTLEANQVKAKLYSDSDVETAPNVAPTINMVMAHKGNKNPLKTNRQSTFYISSKDGSIIQLMNVQSPKLYRANELVNGKRYSNYGVVLGKLPQDLFEYVKEYFSSANANHPYLYARGAVIQDLVMLDYLGQPIRTERYRGTWDENIAKSEDVNERYKSTQFIYDTVTWNGSLWECRTSDTTAEPKPNEPDWNIKISKGDDGEGGMGEVVNFYGVSDSVDVMPTEWKDTIKELVVNEGQYLWTKIVVHDSDGNIVSESYTASYQGKDSTSVTYSLNTNVNIIYIHDRQSASTQYISVSVGRTSSAGYEEIVDSDRLSELGYKLQYAFDSTSDARHDLIINQTAILLDDNTELVTEAGNDMLYEFTVEDILSVKDHITFYLVEKSTGKDWAIREVDVVRDGAAGTSSLTVELDTPTITINVEASEDNTGKVLTSNTDYFILAKAKIGGVVQLASNYTWAAKDSFGNNLTIVGHDSNTRKVRYTINSGVQANTIPDWIDFIIVTHDANNNEVSTSSRVSIIKSQRGLTGAAGKAGVQYYSMGDFSVDVANLGSSENGGYERTDGHVPFVRDTTVENEDYAYFERTSNPYRYENGKMLTPSEDYAKGTPYAWKLMPKYSAARYDLIMAKNARFGSRRGGVFYDKYLYSTYGQTESGTQQPHDAYATSMFDGDDKNGYTLNGAFIPNLFLDFYSGAAKFNMLSEPFTYMGADEYVHVIDPTRGHNLSVRSRKAFSNDGTGAPCLVILPEVNDMIYYNGLRCTIIAEGVASVDNKIPYNPTSATFGDAWDDGDYSIGHKMIIVCADPTLKTGTVDNKGMSPTDNVFCVGGRFAKFIAMEPASMLHLRCCISSYIYGGREVLKPIWYVENSSDFEPTSINIQVEYPMGGSIYETVDYECNYEGWYQQGAFVAMGTKYVNAVRSTSNKGSNGKYAMLNFKYERGDESMLTFIGTTDGN